MTDRDELRRLIQDNPRLEVGKLVGYGNDFVKAFILPRKPILADSLEVYVEGELQNPEGYDVNLETGGIKFHAAPFDGDEITATYYFAALSDAELDGVLERNPGSIYLAAAEAIQLLLAGRGRLVNFAKADGRVDVKSVRQDLMKLAEHYRRLGGTASGAKVESFDYPRLTNGDGD